MRQIRENHIQLVRGDTGNITLSLSQNNESLKFEPGDKLYLTVKKNIKSEKIEIQKIKEIDQEQYETSITIDPQDSFDLSSGDYIYDIQLKRSNGDIYTIILPSTFTIIGAVTHG